MLDLWLVKFSNVFFTDINLYDLNGQLISTSRPQIFQEGLLSPCMNPGAFKELDINRKTIFIQQERIGTLRYYSDKGGPQVPPGLDEAVELWDEDAFEAVARTNFGDHAEVTATPEGFSVEDYEHD